MAQTNSYLYGLPTTGLRLFTVYGPWGRPDMALFIFAKAIIEEKPIKVFQYPGLDDIEKCHVLYVNSEQGFNMNPVLNRTHGNNTLVIGEGYDFIVDNSHDAINGLCLSLGNE